MSNEQSDKGHTSDPAGFLSSGVIESNAMYLRALLPEKYHDFFDKLAAQARAAALAHQRASVPSSTPRTIEAEAGKYPMNGEALLAILRGIADDEAQGVDKDRKRGATYACQRCIGAVESWLRSIPSARGSFYCATQQGDGENAGVPCFLQCTGCEYYELKRRLAELETIPALKPTGADAFTMRLADELFGCHLGAHHENGIYECAVCEQMIPIEGWVTAKHADDCFINDVRDYLAKHLPESVPGWPAHDDIQNEGQKS